MSRHHRCLQRRMETDGGAARTAVRLLSVHRQVPLADGWAGFNFRANTFSQEVTR